MAGNLVDNNGVTNTFNDANQLTGDGTDTFDYDDNGNLWKTNSVVSHTWDRANRLLSHGGLDYAYDGLGNRISQDNGSAVTKYLLDMQAGLPRVLSETVGSNVTQFVHSPRGLHATQNNSSNWFWGLQDGLGSQRAEVDVNGAVVASQEFTPYGVAQNVTGSFNSPHAFTGEPVDANGLQYHRARYYDPAMGVWASLDPLETANRYGYVDGNVVNAIDPSGLCPQEELCRMLEINGHYDVAQSLCYSQNYCDGNIWDDNHKNCSCPIGYEKVQESKGAMMYGYFCRKPDSRRLYYNPHCPDNVGPRPAGTKSRCYTDQENWNTYDPFFNPCEEKDGALRGDLYLYGEVASSYGITGQGGTGGFETVWNWATMEKADFEFQGVITGGGNFSIGFDRLFYHALGTGFTATGDFISEYIGDFHGYSLGISPNAPVSVPDGFASMFKGALGAGIGVGQVQGSCEYGGSCIVANYYGVAFGLSIAFMGLNPGINVAHTLYRFVEQSRVSYGDKRNCKVNMGQLQGDLALSLGGGQPTVDLHGHVELWEARCREGCLG